MPARSLGAALSLLRRLLEVGPGGRVFTSEEAVAVGTDVGLTREHTYKLLSQLVDRGLLERPRGRLYVMRPPLGGLMPVRPLAIAVRAVAPAAVSGDTALAHWGLLSQAPMHEEVVSSPARIRWMGSSTRGYGHDRLWTIGGMTIRFRRVRPEDMFGITSVRLDSETVVPMFDRERTILELVMQPTPGSADWAVELIRGHGAAVDRARLRRYATQLRADGRLDDILHRSSMRGRTIATA